MSLDPSSLLASQNPSYQNYLAKKMLANPATYGLKVTSNEVRDINSEVNASIPLVQEFDKLNSLLDSIDSKSVGTTSENIEKNGSNSSNIEPSPYDWSLQFDSFTSHYYYFNHRTGSSQWERPEGYIDSEVALPQVSNSSTDIFAGGAIDPYAAVASFNSKTNKFSDSGTKNYFEKIGRAPDREGRQMSAFFDMQSLEHNRLEAKEKRKELLETKGIDWRKYKEERKRKRAKISNRWLYEDDV